jgi:hypothetical protein
MLKEVLGISASSDHRGRSAARTQRIQQMVDDSSMHAMLADYIDAGYTVTDMHYLNGRQADPSFDEFMHRVSQRLEERSTVAADERRAAATATEAQPQAAEVVVRPTPLAVSMRVRHASIEADMRADPTITAYLVVGKVKVPSLAVFKARMVPGPSSHATSSRYNGTAGIRWHIQRRRACRYHPHAHYNNSQGRTLREWAISAQDAGFTVAFVSDDDKSKVSIG